MRSGQEPHDETFTAEQLASTVGALDAATDEDLEALLSALLCAAWPTCQAQRQ